MGEPAYALTLALGLLKNRSRFETALEKAVEAGVHTFVPLLTARTEKPTFRAARAEGILTAAMKQSGRSRRVRLAPPRPFDAVLSEDGHDLVLLCHEQAGAERSVLDALRIAPDARRLLVLVGPEGGFTQDEVAQAGARGAHLVSLGPRRLRAETAGIVAAAAVMLARL